uniref:Putative secreted protein n=1 Tax=Ixodes ricinus TaxID=34613 RepID=A0A6B0UWK8_IXORI
MRRFFLGRSICIAPLLLLLLVEELLLVDIRKAQLALLVVQRDAPTQLERLLRRLRLPLHIVPRLVLHPLQDYILQATRGFLRDGRRLPCGVLEHEVLLQQAVLGPPFRFHFPLQSPRARLQVLLFQLVDPLLQKLLTFFERRFVSTALFHVQCFRVSKS